MAASDDIMWANPKKVLSGHKVVFVLTLLISSSYLPILDSVSADFHQTTVGGYSICSMFS